MGLLLEGKVAVVTGAGSGMGKASVQVFVREGAKVVAADVSGAEEDTAKELGDAVHPVHCDVTQEADVEAMIASASDTFGALDVVCNVAGIADAAMIADVTDVIALAEAGAIVNPVEEFAFDDVEEAYRRLDKGELRGRAVVVFDEVVSPES